MSNLIESMIHENREFSKEKEKKKASKVVESKKVKKKVKESNQYHVGDYIRPTYDDPEYYKDVRQVYKVTGVEEYGDGEDRQIELNYLPVNRWARSGLAAWNRSEGVDPNEPGGEIFSVSTDRYEIIPSSEIDTIRKQYGFYESKKRKKVKEAYLGLDLGKFSPFSKTDWYGYAGASPIDNDEPLIYHGDQFDILISGEADAPSSSALDGVYIEVDIFVDEESGQTVVGTKGPMSLQRAIRSANRLVAFDTESLSVNDIIEELEESGFDIQII